MVTLTGAIAKTRNPNALERDIQLPLDQPTRPIHSSLLILPLRAGERSSDIAEPTR